MDCLSNEWCLTFVLRFPSSAIGSKQLTKHQTFCFFYPIKISIYVAYTCFRTLSNSDVFLAFILIGSFIFVVLVNTMTLLFMTAVEKLFCWYIENNGTCFNYSKKHNYLGVVCQLTVWDENNFNEDWAHPRCKTCNPYKWRKTKNTKKST